MNTLLITTHFPPKKGGVESSNIEYLNFFESKKDIECTVLTYENRYNQKFIDYWKRSKIIRIRIPFPLLNFMIGLKSVSTLDSLPKQIAYMLLHICFLLKGILTNLPKLLKSDFVIANGALVESVVAYILSLITRKKYVVRWRTDFSNTSVNILAGRVLRRASCIIVNGIDIKKRIGMLVKDKEKVFVSKHPINTKIFFPISKNEARKKLGLPPSKFVISFAGALNKTKFFDTLLELIPLIPEEDPTFSIIITGEGPLEHWCRKIGTCPISCGNLMYFFINRKITVSDTY